MIMVTCDVCHETICTGGTSIDIKEKFESGSVEEIRSMPLKLFHGYFSHVCSKCEEAYTQIDIQELFRMATLNNRLDLRKETSA